MADRVIRDELLESERWLSLKDNADRLAYVALLLKADSLGDFSAEQFRLLRLWRDFGINTQALVVKTLTELADHDLVRLYEADGKTLLHIPRFRQRLRHLKRVFPPSPWITVEEKQTLNKNSPVPSQTQDGLASAEGKGSEGKGREGNKTLAQGFAQFWSAYPKRKSKGDAEKAWSKLKPNEQFIAQILRALERAKTSESWQRDNGQFIPYPATWLRAKGWEDETETVEAKRKFTIP